MRASYLIGAVVFVIVFFAIVAYLEIGILTGAIQVSIAGEYVPVQVMWAVIVILLVLSLAYTLKRKKSPP